MFDFGFFLYFFIQSIAYKFQFSINYDNIFTMKAKIGGK